MKLKRNLLMTIIAAFFGFMLALQFKTITKQEISYTRDIGELQVALAKAEKTHINLSQKLAQTQHLLKKYKKREAEVSIQAMKKELKKLKRRAGLTKVTDSGVTLTIAPMVFVQSGPYNHEPVTDTLLRRLMNQLNQFGATEISVDGERIINTSPIRMVNGQLTVNDHPIDDVPFKIKVLAPKPEMLKKKLDVSQIAESFARSGLQIAAKIEQQLTLPAYEGTIHTEHLNVAEGGT